MSPSSSARQDVLHSLYPISIAGGWGRQKLLANLDGLRLPWALRTRRAIQCPRRVSAADFAARLMADLDSPTSAAPAARSCWARRCAPTGGWSGLCLAAKLSERGACYQASHWRLGPWTSCS